MRLIIAGDRRFEDYALLCSWVHDVSHMWAFTVIVSGGAWGADRMGERYAKENGIRLVRFDADWDAYGNAAGPRRNREMAEYANALLAFRASDSKGTRDMIEQMFDAGKPSVVIPIQIKDFDDDIPF